MKNTALLFSITFFLAGCQTFHFENGDKELNSNYVTEDFHHIGVLRLVEFSSPVQPKKICDDKEWSTVRTRKGPLQVLIGLVVGGFYNPEEVSVSCKN